MNDPDSDYVRMMQLLLRTIKDMLEKQYGETMGTAPKDQYDAATLEKWK